jgi:hypothetical protein
MPRLQNNTPHLKEHPGFQQLIPTTIHNPSGPHNSEVGWMVRGWGSGAGTPVCVAIHTPHHFRLSIDGLDIVQTAR